MSQTPVAPPPAMTATIPPQSGVLDTDRPCVQCSYNLRGLGLSGNCPECGSSVQQSLRGILLEFASPDYLATVRSGLRLVLTGILLYIALQIITTVAAVALAGPGIAGGGFTLVGMALGLGVQGLILFGYWQYTQPDPGFVGTDLPDTPRKVVRIAVAAQAAAGVIQAGLTFAMLSSGAAGVVFGGLFFVVSFTAFAAWIAGFIGIMLYTQWLAKRIPDGYIVNRAKLFLWLLPVIAVVGALLIIGPLIALVMYWNLLDRMRKHLKSIIATGEPASLPARFG